MEIYQILIPFLSIIMIFRAISKFRRAPKTLRRTLVSAFFWGGAAAIAIFPDFFVRSVEKFTGLKSGITGILVFAILVLSVVIFFLLQENERRAEEIAEIVREITFLKK